MIWQSRTTSIASARAEYLKLTLTGMYNVLDKLRTGGTLTAKDKVFHGQGLVSILRELHDELDQARRSTWRHDTVSEQA